MPVNRSRHKKISIYIKCNFANPSIHMNFVQLAPFVSHRTFSFINAGDSYRTSKKKLIRLVTELVPEKDLGIPSSGLMREEDWK
jgi:hypothetical protein